MSKLFNTDFVIVYKDNSEQTKLKTEIDNLYKFLWESGYSIGEIDHISWGGWGESWGHKRERLNVHTEVDVAYWKDKNKGKI